MFHCFFRLFLRARTAPESLFLYNMIQEKAKTKSINKSILNSYAKLFCFDVCRKLSFEMTAGSEVRASDGAIRRKSGQKRGEGRSV